MSDCENQACFLFLNDFFIEIQGLGEMTVRQQASQKLALIWVIFESEKINIQIWKTLKLMPVFEDFAGIR